MQRGERRDPVMTLVLYIVTCGLYGLYWLFKATEEINAGNNENYNFITELLLSMVTCGLWGIWWNWRLSESIVNMEKNWGRPPKMEPALLFITCLFGLGPLFLQMSMNNAWEGQPRLGSSAPQHHLDGPGF